MLESALYYQQAFHHLELSNSNYKSCPSRSDWERIEKISKFLGIFDDITHVFSGTKYPTANLYFPSIFVQVDIIDGSFNGCASIGHINWEPHIGCNRKQHLHGFLFFNRTTDSMQVIFLFYSLNNCLGKALYLFSKVLGEFLHR